MLKISYKHVSERTRLPIQPLKDVLLISQIKNALAAEAKTGSLCWESDDCMLMLIATQQSVAVKVSAQVIDRRLERAVFLLGFLSVCVCVFKESSGHISVKHCSFITVNSVKQILQLSGRDCQ